MNRTHLLLCSFLYFAATGLAQDLPPIQRFMLDPQQSNRVIGADGTTLWIEANSFVFPDGRQLKDSIELILTEAYDYPAVSESRSGECRLEMGGMLYLEALANGFPLVLDEEKPILLALPTEVQLPEMQLFTASTARSKGVDEWIPTGQLFRPELAAMLDLPPQPQYPRFYFNPPLFEPDEAGKPKSPDYKQARRAYAPGGTIYEATLARQQEEYEFATRTLRAEMEAWKILRNKQLEAFEERFVQAGKRSTAFLEHYYFQLSKLGWVACGRRGEESGLCAFSQD